MLDWSSIETAHAAGRTLTALWIDARERDGFAAGYQAFLKRRKEWRTQLEAEPLLNGFPLGGKKGKPGTGEADRRARSEVSGGTPEARIAAERPLFSPRPPPPVLDRLAFGATSNRVPPGVPLSTSTPLPARQKQPLEPVAAVRGVLTSIAPETLLAVRGRAIVARSYGLEQSLPPGVRTIIAAGHGFAATSAPSRRASLPISNCLSAMTRKPSSRYLRRNHLPTPAAPL
jgi:hypothetical protein